MKTGDQAPGPLPELRGWDAIASALGVARNTAIRWHAQDGLPVHHFRGRVYARPSEIASWFERVAS